MARKSEDQLVAPASTPVVRFASDEAAQTVIAPIRAQYEQVAAFVAQQMTLAGQKLARVGDLTREADQLSLEARQHEYQAQQGSDVVKGLVDTLAALGVEVAPLNGELSHTPDLATARWNAAVDEQNAAEGLRP
ncbi:hypothetical protein [Planobispora rosea]|uniref:hypothetical protein n=1 Tax=Planobispora rosea TaxID=35762 RepID=UPI00114D23AB|nr:hypothetical protein [Planobispora rosea]